MNAQVWFDRYRYVKVIGKSTRGSMVLVEDMYSEEFCVMKFIRKEYIDYARREARVLGHLRHPAFPWLHEVKKDEDNFYIFMECLRGQTLWKYRVQRERVQIEDVVDTGLRLCEALKYLHEKKPNPILHLDIQPENILIDESGDIKLIDFGNSVFFTPGIQTEECLGTLGFAAPEQYIIGQPIDERTDIFSVGRVLLFLITGQSVHEEPALLEKELLRYRNMEPDKSSVSAEELLRLIQHCTHPSVTERIRSVSALEKRLKELSFFFRYANS